MYSQTDEERVILEHFAQRPSGRFLDIGAFDGRVFSNTLALAEYRSGHWAESLAASERSMEMRKRGDANDWFLVAMARWQKGDKDEARKWFDKAVAGTKDKDPKNSGKQEPMVWVATYGKGRVCENVLGHDVDAMKSLGFQTLLTRCVEWAATGEVHSPVPAGLKK